MASMPYDADGAGDWTVAGLHTQYTPEEWEAIRATFKHHWWMGRVWITDRADPQANHKSYNLFQRLAEWWFAL